jgi:transposase-like protein
MKYTIKQLQSDFKDDNACLEFLYQARYADKPCARCGKQYRFTRIKTRKVYSCNNCASHISPTAGTIFHKSDTPLTLWFHAIFLMSTSKNGVAAKELERQLGVTYKTAWRLARQIRLIMKDEGDLLKGVIEVDETYIGGKQKGVMGRAVKNSNKMVVFGMVERGGQAKAFAVPDSRGETLLPHFKANAVKGSTIMSDQYTVYDILPYMGYQHYAINHTKNFARGTITTNSIEGFWGS